MEQPSHCVFEWHLVLFLETLSRITDGQCPPAEKHSLKETPCPLSSPGVRKAKLLAVKPKCSSSLGPCRPKMDSDLLVGVWC
jgi:hypothetical protein